MLQSPSLRRAGGFTLIELVVVLAVLGILAGSMLPMVHVVRDGERTIAVEAELERIAAALHAHYGEHGRFPVALDEPRFVGQHLDASVDRRGLLDDFRRDGGLYGYAGTTSPDVVVVWSVGPDGVDDGGRAEPLAVTVYGAVAGLARTRQRLVVIAAALAGFLAGGGRLSGDWEADRRALGLGPAFATDGFGVPFASRRDVVAIDSAGPDRRFGTADDLGL